MGPSYNPNVDQTSTGWIPGLLKLENCDLEAFQKSTNGVGQDMANCRDSPVEYSFRTDCA
jgi:hypothetical protein